MSISEIKTAVMQLSKDELTELAEWLEDFHQSQWDSQIEEDLRNGKLDFLITEAEKSYKAGDYREI